MKPQNNEIVQIQKILLRQMNNLSESTARSEIDLEIKRSGALSSNASAYLKAVGTSLKVKEMSKRNKRVENDILREIGVASEK